MTGLELKLKRIQTGLRQYELAARVGISPTQLCEIERGRREASPELIQRIFKEINGESAASRKVRQQARQEYMDHE